jgi:hypothetical protein
MGRYDRKKGKLGRYADKKAKKKTGLSRYLVVILIILAALGGYYADRMPNIDLGLSSFSLPIIAPAKEKAVQSELKIPSKIEDSSDDSWEQIPADNLETLPQAEEAFILPELGSSDSAVRSALFEAAPDLMAWLGSDNLIKNYLAIANDFSQGIRIAKHFRFLKLQDDFHAEQQANVFILGKPSYRRYDNLVNAIDAIDTAKILSVYKKFRPLLLEAFAEYGYPKSHSLEDILNKAAAQILAAPIIGTPITLKKAIVNYKFADPQLESLNPVHKQMLRMGPENTRIIQNKLRSLVAELGNLNCSETEC